MASAAMRQVHKAGEKSFVDYAGKKASIVDPTTGPRLEVEFFVATLSASNFTDAEANDESASPRLRLCARTRPPLLRRSFGHLGPGSAKKRGVCACRYEPGIQRTYADFARHCDSAVVPARPYKPRDKVKVEVGIEIALIAERVTVCVTP